MTLQQHMTGKIWEEMYYYNLIIITHENANIAISDFKVNVYGYYYL